MLVNENAYVKSCYYLRGTLRAHISARTVAKRRHKRKHYPTSCTAHAHCTDSDTYAETHANSRACKPYTHAVQAEACAKQVPCGQTDPKTASSSQHKGPWWTLFGGPQGGQPASTAARRRGSHVPDTPSSAANRLGRLQGAADEANGRSARTGKMAPHHNNMGFGPWVPPLS